MAINAGDIVWTVDADVSKFEAAVTKSSKSIQNFGKAFTAIGAVGVSAIGGITVAAIKVASDVNTASKKMAASLGFPADVADEFADKIKTVYGDNFGDSLEDVGDKMTATFQQFSRVSDSAIDDIERLTEATISISDAFDVDVNEAASAAATLMENFGVTSSEALDMVAAGFQRGMNAQGDFLDSIGEYSVQFSEAGATANEFFSVLASGMQGGMLGTDKAADAMKEFRVRIQDGSDGINKALESIGIKSEKFLGELASGQMSVVDAFTEVQGKLGQVTDSSLQMQAGVALIGSQFEDMGAKAILAINTTNFGILEGQQGVASLQEQYNNLGSALEGLKRKALIALEPLGAGLLDAINQNMPQIIAAFDALSEMGPKVAQAIVPIFTKLLDVILPVIAAVVDFTAQNPGLVSSLFLIVGAVSSVLVVLGPLLMALPGLVTAFGAVSSIVPVVGAVIAALTGPIGLIIVAVVAATVLIVRNWEWVKQTTTNIFAGIAQAIQFYIGLWTNPIRNMIALINSLISKINQLTGMNIPGIPGFASGGVVPGFASGGMIQGLAGGGQSRHRVVKVGEQGPELAALPVGSRVLSHADMMRAAQQGLGGGNYGTQVTVSPPAITINSNETDPEKLVEKLKGPFSRWMATELRAAIR